MHPLNRVREVSLCLKLLQVPYSVCMNGEYFGEASSIVYAPVAWAFNVRLCDKFPYIMGWRFLNKNAIIASFWEI